MKLKTFPALAKAGQIAALRSGAFWRSVDSFKDLKEAEEYLAAPRPKRGCFVC